MIGELLVEIAGEDFMLGCLQPISKRSIYIRIAFVESMCIVDVVLLLYLYILQEVEKIIELICG